MNTPSLTPIFAPRSVAVVGASRKRDSIGFSLVRNLVAAELNGTIFPVNPHAAVIHSLKCYPSLSAIPDPIDLALIAVPRIAVEEAVEEAIRVGVKGLVVITAGFAETGEEGRERERKLVAKVRAAGIRMVGPNCMGVINADPEVRLNATFAPVPGRPGTIGFVSQSGALGVAILNVAAELGIGLTQFVSMGNKADVSGNDLLEYWEDDPETRVIAMYLESFGNPRRFTEIAKRVGAKKPILVVKSGRTTEGARAASSHTGALAGADVSVSAFLERCGVLRADTIEELFDVARALDRCPLPAGDRIAILTNAGGPAIMATDACVNLGLTMASLAAETQAALAAFLPPEASLANPVDMIASANEASYGKALAALLADPGVDVVMVINVTPLLYDPADVMETVAAVAAAQRQAKPVVAVMMATEAFYEKAKQTKDHPPVYRFPEAATRAVAQLVRYAEWRRRPAETTPPELHLDDSTIAAILARATDGYLPTADAFAVLAAAGIPLARYRIAGSEAEALALASEVGYPLVLKADALGLVHKSEVGAVKVGIESEEELAAALHTMAESLARAGFVARSFLLQEMVAGGHEVICGLSTDPRFGPILLFGLGGKYVEVLHDVKLGVTPLSVLEAEEMVRGIKGFPLLAGVRGERPADLGVLTEVLLRLGELARRHPTIRELDINPFLASPDRERALALDARLRVERGGGVTT